MPETCILHASGVIVLLISMCYSFSLCKMNVHVQMYHQLPLNYSFLEEIIVHDGEFGAQRSDVLPED